MTSQLLLATLGLLAIATISAIAPQAHATSVTNAPMPAPERQPPVAAVERVVRSDISPREAPVSTMPPDSGRERVSSCDTWRNAVAIPGGYRNSITGCYPIGAVKSTVIYKWERTGGSNGSKACVQGKGFNSLGAPVWQNSGCGSAGTTALLWGNVTAKKRIRMFAAAGAVVNLTWR